MYVEGTLDLLELIIMHPFLKPDDQQKEVVNMAQKAIIRYFPVFEKVGGREACAHSITRPQSSCCHAPCCSGLGKAEPHWTNPTGHLRVDSGHQHKARMSWSPSDSTRTTLFGSLEKYGLTPCVHYCSCTFTRCPHM